MINTKIIFPLLFTCLFSNNLITQELSFILEKEHTSQFGENSDLVSFIPLFELNSDTIHNKTTSAKIKKHPPHLDNSNLVYGFIFFTGNENTVFSKEIAFIINNHGSKHALLFIDKNGNLDFTDDGEPSPFIDKTILKLSNHQYTGAHLHYRIGKSEISEANQDRMRKRYAGKFPNGKIISPTKWLTSTRLNTIISNHLINNQSVSIILFDGDADGIYTFDTTPYGDRIFISENKIDKTEDLMSYIRQGQPIDHNATFILFDKKYSLKNISSNGNSLTIEESDKQLKTVFKEKINISSFKIDFLNKNTITIKELLSDHEYLIIDVGGTWCGGCISQEPTIKKIFANQNVQVIGVFGHDTEASVSKYVKQHEIQWPVALMSEEFKDKFRISSYPTYFLISAAGDIILITNDSESILDYFDQ